MKKILISFLCVITLFATCFGIMQVCETKQQVKAESVAVENEELFKMYNGAAFRLYWSTPNCGISFGCKISDSLVEKYNPKLFLVPYDYITEVLNGDNIVAKTKMQYGDYKGAIVEAGKDFVEVEPCVVKYDGYSELVAGIKNIKDSNVNRKFFGVYYYEKGTTRVYADVLYDNPINNARSMAYVTSSSWYDQWSNVSYFEEMHTFWMDKAIARAAYKADVTDATPASLSYSSPALGGSTKYSDTVRKDRVVFVSNTTNYGGQDGVSATYYDDLFTYDLVLSYIADDGKGNYSSKNVIVTENLDFKVKVEVTSNGKNYVSYNDQTGYISVKNTTSSAVEQGVKTWVGIGDPLNQKLVINSFDLNAKSSYVDIDTKDQYYEDFDNQPSLYKPFSTVTIKADGVKRIYEKSYTTIPTYSNNGRVTQSGQVATVTISGDGTNVVNSASGNFTIYGEDQRVWKLTLHHKNVNGVTIADDTVINFNASGAKDFGGLKGYIYDENLTANEVSVKSIIASICEGNNDLQKKYLPSLEWVEGIITGDTEITILYSPYDEWDGSYYASEVAEWLNATTPEEKAEIEASVYDGGDGTSKATAYIINTAEQLAFMAKISYNIDYGEGYYFQLGQSLDLSKHYWTPICFDSGSYDWNFFRGEFEGNGYTIKIKIDASQGAKYLDNGVEKTLSKAWGYGLFTGVAGQVRNLTMMGSDSVEHRTGIVSYLLRYGGKVENINNFATVTATRTSVGDGLVFTGGIVGAGGQSSSNTDGVEFINCNNYGAVTTNLGLTGGIVGECYTKNTILQNCNNFGVVTGGHKTGGIVGRTTQRLENCNNFGNVVLTTAVSSNKITEKVDGVPTTIDYYGTIIGGIAGTNAGGDAINCINYGNIICKNSSGAVVGDTVGGICGEASRAYVYNCQNYGTITASTNVGDIYGAIQDANDNPEDEEHILKLEFYDANGKMIYDYKNVALLVGTKYDRNTDVGINIKMPITWMAEYFGVTWTTIENGTDANGKNATYAINWDYIWKTDDDGNYVLDSSGNKIQIEKDKINLTRGKIELLLNVVGYQVT
ncbi:MAG: hypothetical protein J6C97_00535 [Clostridia bacterium]|nr:hypothetical protein [Clostridia bacterium]